MGAVVLESTSNKKLLSFAIVLLILQIGTFLIGGLIAPSPSNVQSLITTWCRGSGKQLSADRWYYQRPVGGCDVLHQEELPDDINADQIVFIAQIPFMRDGVQLQMSRWFQFILAIMDMDIPYKAYAPMGSEPKLLMDIKLGYRNEGEDDWKLLAASNETRDLVCGDVEKKSDGEYYPCQTFGLFELGSCFYDYYLVNFRLPTQGRDSRFNKDMGWPEDIHNIFISQNGGFTQVWLSMKAVLFPIILIALVVFWWKVRRQGRSPNLLEKSILMLGIALTLLNFPVDFLTLAVDMPFMLLYTDIRQGLFYTALMVFWVIFCGEHMMDNVQRQSIWSYWKHLSAVIFGSICLFVFEICERGVQLKNPFYSIWVTSSGRKLAMSFIVLAALAGFMYICLLSYMTFRTMRNIAAKKSALPHMNHLRRTYYLGLIYRFKVMMSVTFICAFMSVVFYVVSQIKESAGRFDEDYQQLEYVSAFFTGVYGMWNLYVFSLLILYAPSNTMSSIPLDETATLQEVDDTEGIEHIEFQSLPTEHSSLAAFTAKAAID